MKLYQTTFIVFLLTTISATYGCEKEKIKYEISRFSTDYKVNHQKYEQEIIQNDKEAYIITLGGTLNRLCKGSLNITVKANHFYADNTEMTEIEPGTFENQHIESQLRITGSNLTIIRAGTFENLAITELTLINNKIQTIEDGAMKNLQRLTTLYLGNNQLVHFAENAISNTPKLMWLDVSKNKLTNFRKKMFTFMSTGPIIGIGASDNEIDFIDPEAFYGINLYSLTLSNNKLKVIPAEVFKGHRNVTELHFDNNQLTTLDDSFFTLDQLSNVYLKGNKFSCDVVKKLKEFKEVNEFTSSNQPPSNSEFSRPVSEKVLDFDENEEC